MTKKKFMAMAYESAKLGEYSTKPGVNVGCIIEKNNKERLSTPKTNIFV